MSIELWILLYLLCGVGVAVRRVWLQGSLETPDFLFLPLFVVFWPWVLPILLVMWMTSGPARVLWRRKK